MARKNDKLQDMGGKQVASLGGVVIKMLAIGFAGGAALIAGANKAGKAIQVAEAKKREAESEKFKAEAAELEAELAEIEELAKKREEEA
ncbi:MAG: hypothetical protein PUD55_00305 [Firmicutes bacterium]|nr:hypothetical protein [Bacillota bacterium]